MIGVVRFFRLTNRDSQCRLSITIAFARRWPGMAALCVQLTYNEVDHPSSHDWHAGRGIGICDYLRR